MHDEIAEQRQSHAGGSHHQQSAPLIDVAGNQHDDDIEHRDGHAEWRDRVEHEDCARKYRGGDNQNE